MASLTEAIGGVISGAVAPITNLLTKKQEVRQARQMAMAQLTLAQQNNAKEITIGDQHLEAILAEAGKTSWKDEYVTVSLVCIINAVVVGGILQGFDYPSFMIGVLTGVETLSKLIDLKFCMTAVITSAIGLNIWRKV